VGLLRKVFDYIDEVTKYILFILLGVMLIVAFLQIFYRSVLSISVSWTDELTRYLFIWSVFIGVAYSIRRNGHISIETIYLFIKEENKAKFNKIVYAIQFIFFVGVLIFSMNFVINNFWNVSPVLQLPMGFVYISLPIGCLLCWIFLVEKIFFNREEVKE
jgi:TRAP-type transport system small permease protein